MEILSDGSRQPSIAVICHSTKKKDPVVVLSGGGRGLATFRYCCNAELHLKILFGLQVNAHAKN